MEVISYSQQPFVSLVFSLAVGLSLTNRIFSFFIPFPWFLLLGCNRQAQDYNEVPNKTSHKSHERNRYQIPKVGEHNE